MENISQILSISTHKIWYIVLFFILWLCSLWIAYLIGKKENRKKYIPLYPTEDKKCSNR